MTDGTDRIAAERDRQLDLGFTQDHDAHHDDGDLPFAAAVYAAPATIYLLRIQDEDPQHGHSKGGRVEWVEPWPLDWEQKPRATNRGERIRELEKAGALIAAEIDRLLAIDEADQEISG